MKLYIHILIALVITSQTVSGLQDICRAVVLEGGGDLGAFEAGVLDGLVDALGEDAQWDVVAGVSVGALTSGALSQYPKGQEKAATNWLVDFWHNIDKSQVYKNWVPGGMLQGLIDERGIYDTEPLKATVKEFLLTTPKRLLSVLACDVNTGLYHRYDETLTLEEFQESVITSASVPMLFPWQDFKGAQLFDGGVCKMTDISGAIQKCRTLVGPNNDDKIHVSLVYISNKALEPWTGKETSFESLNRYFKINNFRKCYRELAASHDFYPLVNYDYVIFPSKPLPGAKFPFTFGKDRLLEMINQGRADATAEVAKGPGASIENFLKMAKLQECEDHDVPCPVEEVEAEVKYRRATLREAAL